jgi:hypothetical protein
VTQLSRLTKLAFAPEVTPGTYLVPTVALPFDKADYEDAITEIKDESFRANDSVLQGLYPGSTVATWSIDLLAYPDLLGHFLRGIIGPDTVTAATVTALSTAVSVVGATSVETAASIPAGSTIRISTGSAAEYAVTGTPTGVGPYTIPITTPSGGLTKTHLDAAVVTTQTTHTFKQSPTAAKRTFSLSVDDTTNNPMGYTAATMSDLGIKIDPKGAVQLSVKMTAMPGQAQSAFVPSYVEQPPLLGWQWQMVNAGASSSRGLTLDYTIKRAVEPVHSSVGTQGPREIFQGALEADFSYKAIFESQVDLDLYLKYSQQPAVATLTQPPHLGGCQLAISMAKAGVSKGKRDFANYVQAQFSGSGIYNATDGGSVSATLKNFVTSVY